jgi:hypothetical protein
MVSARGADRVRARLRRGVVALCAGVVAGSFASGLPVTPASAFEGIPVVSNCTAAPTLAEGAVGDDVRCLQFALIMFGFPAPYTGMFDRETADQVFWFQAARPDLDADGMAGPATLDALGILAVGEVAVVPFAFTCLADATILPFASGRSVECVQQRLIELGHYQGAITGTNDVATQMGILSFQRTAPPIAADGIAGPRTLAAMGIWSGNTVVAGAGPVFVPGAPVPSQPATVGPGPWPAPMQAQPNWRLTPDGLPVYGNRTPCTRAQADVIAAEFARDGADVATQQWAVYIATREGGCRHDAVNINPATRDDSHCTFQINALAGTFGPFGELGRRGWTAENVKTSLSACADAASDLWVFCGRGPWEPPYSCSPPWRDGMIGLPDANIPTTTTSTTVPPITLPPTAPSTTVAAPPSGPPPAAPPVPTTTPPTVPTTTSPPSTTVVEGP